jgi:acetylornithine deacetylase/succinyl-diaminopimelate desuccinylase family protein
MGNSTELTEEILLLQQLVRTNSEDPPGDTRECVRLLGEILDGEGIPYQIAEPQPGIRSLTASLKGRRGPGKTLLFNGHIDTVPAGEGWTVDPFGAVIRDGYLYGRGSTDMKAGIAAALKALLDIRRGGADFFGEVIFTAVGDEEYHSQYGTKYLLEQGLKADFAVNCEPTHLDLCLGNRGLLMVDVKVRGRSVHAGRPHLGKNAVALASRIIEGLGALDFSSTRDDRFKTPLGSLSVVGIRGGERMNVIPDFCEFFIDRRLMPGESSNAALKQIKECITRLAGDEEGFSVFLHPELWHEPFWMEKDHPFVQACTAVYQTVFNKAPVYEGKSAGTDASHLVSMGKIPTIIFGPGDYQVSHTVDEKLELAQMGPAVAYYSALIKNLLQ